MTTPMTVFVFAALAAGTGPFDPGGSTGQVTLPLAAWTELMEQFDPTDNEDQAPPTAIATIERSLDGAYRKGLLYATLVTRFQVFEKTGHVRVPVVSAEVSPSAVRLNGKPTSLVDVDGMYTVGVEQPGVYEVKVTFYTGREQDRFARQLEVDLPPGGTTRIAIVIPEQDIVAHLEHGTLTTTGASAGGTKLEGFLDASGVLDLSWTRRITHKGDSSVELSARVNTLFTVHEAVMTGVAVFDIDVLDGETDRLDFALPPDLEVTQVAGDAVLQWRSDERTLTVLLRYLVDERMRVAVHFQYAPAAQAAISLRMPLMPERVDMVGSVGVQAPAGLKVEVADVVDARELTPRDLPLELTELTGNPLLFGFSFSSPPQISLSVHRLEQVELTSTLIDEVEASSVLIEDGTEVTKMKLHIRNNTRQYLRVRFYDGETLTHALIDGQPVRPAIEQDDTGQTLLFSLRQSERVDPDVGRVHKVRPGETLGDIALAYYTDPGKWTLILEGNRDRLASETSVRAGQILRIPSAGPVTIEESSFVLELAYRRKRGHMGLLGTVDIALPDLDVDAMKVTWHVYLPRSITPITFDANLTQYSRIRYGVFRRLMRFVDEALSGRKAWAASDEYQSILSKRRSIYRTEADRKRLAEVSPASFPLVGERYRFKRILIDSDRPRISIFYADNGTISAIRWVAFLAAFALGTLILGSNRRLWKWLVVGAGMAGLLVLGHYALGVHRRMLWGVDAALIVSLVRLERAGIGVGLRDIAWAPWRVVDLMTLDNLYVAVALVVAIHVALAYPLLLSFVALILMATVWQRWNSKADVEVNDA